MTLEHALTFTIPKRVKLIALYGLIATCIWVFASFLHLVMPFFIAWLLAFFLSPLIDWIEGFGVSRVGAILMFFSGVALAVGISVYVMLPAITGQISSIQESLPRYIGYVQTLKNQVIIAVRQEEQDRPWLKQLKVSSSLEKRFGAKSGANAGALTDSILESVGDVASSVLEVIVYMILIPFLLFFFLKDGRTITKTAIRMVPNRYFEMALSMLYQIDQQLRNYVKGQLTDACMVGILSAFGLWAIGLNFAMTVGVIAGVCNIIPYFGPMVGAVMAVAVALIDMQSVSLAVKAVVVLFGVQMIDETLISPLVVSHSVSLHPLLVVFAITMGAAYLGIIGMLVGVPLMAIVVVSMKVLSKGFREYRLS